jgi:hypothetical protein
MPMTEQYEIAALRHFDVAELLLAQLHLDDAGYHFGIAGENALKHALQSAGMEQFWQNNGVGPNKTPMRKHYPHLEPSVVAEEQMILAHAQGRLASPLAQLISAPNHGSRFNNWSIDIRYADTICTPVPAASCAQWQEDAADMLLRLIFGSR